MTGGGHLGATPAATGAVLAGRYRLEARIGRGGMADVFRGEDDVLHRPVAVKVFRFDTAAGDDRRRVDAEIRTLASLRHPGLVTVFDAGTVDEPNGDGTPFLVMELITGPTLGRRLAEGPPGPGQTAQLGAELAATLGYVHASGVVRGRPRAAAAATPHTGRPRTGMGAAADRDDRSRTRRPTQHRRCHHHPYPPCRGRARWNADRNSAHANPRHRRAGPAESCTPIDCAAAPARSPNQAEPG